MLRRLARCFVLQVLRRLYVLSLNPDSEHAVSLLPPSPFLLPPSSFLLPRTDFAFLGLLLPFAPFLLPLHSRHDCLQAVTLLGRHSCIRQLMRVYVTSTESRLQVMTHWEQVHATCLGFEVLAIQMSKNTSLLSKFDATNLPSKLQVRISSSLTGAMFVYLRVSVSGCSTYLVRSCTQYSVSKYARCRSEIRQIRDPA
jgi:hypothetical protein